MALAKTIVIAAAALLLGIFIGGLGPRTELAATKVALEEAEARAKRGSSSTLPLALGLGSLAAARERANEAAARDGDERPRSVPKFVPPEPEGQGGEPDAGRRGFRFGDPETFRAAKAAADLRAAQFRAAFVEQAQLPPAAAAHLDATVKNMNDELERAADEIARDLAARREKSDKIAPRDLADVGARVLEIYRKADDQWKAGLDDNGRAAVGKTDFDLLTQIDIGAFERLSQTLETMDRPRLGAP